MRREADDKDISTAFVQMGEQMPVLNTGIFGYLSGDGFSSVERHESAMRDAVEAFESECVQALSLAPVDSEQLYLRYEMLRPFVVKTLIFVGLLPTDKSFVLLARMVETLAVRPDADLSALIEAEAAESDVEQSTVIRNIDRALDIRDDFTREKLTYLTNTSPFTTRDALYDLALYVRTKFYGGGAYA